MRKLPVVCLSIALSVGSSQTKVPQTGFGVQAFS